MFLEYSEVSNLKIGAHGDPEEKREHRCNFLDNQSKCVFVLVLD